MMKTFEELLNEVGAATLYQGTDVDEATQGALLEWLFDRFLSMYDGDETKWMRRFRRQLNMFYPMYMDYLRVESVRSNLDPFITEFMERVHEGQGSISNSGSSMETSQNGTAGQETTVTDNTNVRTPDLETTSQSGNTRTDNLRNQSSSSDGGTISNTEVATSEDNGKVRGLSIAYPEANMGSIPTNIDYFPSDISYASGESDQFSKNEHDGSATRTENRNLTNQSSGSQTGTVTDNGNGHVQESGTETNEFDGTVVRSKSDSTNGQKTNTNASTGEHSDKSQEIEQGRHESVADLLPRAVNAITSTNSIKWLVNNMLVCFDNYSEIC